MGSLGSLGNESETLGILERSQNNDPVAGIAIAWTAHKDRNYSGATTFRRGRGDECIDSP